MMAATAAEVKVFGANWCPMTRRTLEFLKDHHVPHEYIDIERDPEAAEWVASQNGGKERKPTLDIAGDVIAEPSNDDLETLLAEKGLLP